MIIWEVRACHSILRIDFYHSTTTMLHSYSCNVFGYLFVLAFTLIIIIIISHKLERREFIFIRGILLDEHLSHNFCSLDAASERPWVRGLLLRSRQPRRGDPQPLLQGEEYFGRNAGTFFLLLVTVQHSRY